MTSEEAKQILLLYRTESDAKDAEMAAALEQARRDPELQRWFEQHGKAQTKLREKFTELPVPGGLKEAILAGRKIVRPVLWWQQPAWLAAAAVVAFLIGVATLWMRPDPLERFAFYRAQMVKMALHEYRMDIVTNDLRQVREYLARKGGPAAYIVPKSLEQLKVTGGGHIPWSTAPVSMLCFERGDRQMLFLFVINSSAIKGEPKTRPKLAKISTLQTASWTQGTNTYVLAGPDDPAFLQKYGLAQ